MLKVDLKNVFLIKSIQWRARCDHPALPAPTCFLTSRSDFLNARYHPRELVAGAAGFDSAVVCARERVGAIYVAFGPLPGAPRLGWLWAPPALLRALIQFKSSY